MCQYLKCCRQLQLRLTSHTRERRQQSAEAGIVAGSLLHISHCAFLPVMPESGSCSERAGVAAGVQAGAGPAGEAAAGAGGSPHAPAAVSDPAVLPAEPFIAAHPPVSLPAAWAAVLGRLPVSAGQHRGAPHLLSALQVQTRSHLCLTLSSCALKREDEHTCLHAHGAATAVEKMLCLLKLLTACQCSSASITGVCHAALSQSSLLAAACI